MPETRWREKRDSIELISTTDAKKYLAGKKLYSCPILLRWKYDNISITALCTQQLFFPEQARKKWHDNKFYDSERRE